MLSPFYFGDDPRKRWGQITSLVFFPLPWHHHWFLTQDLKNQSYQVIYSKVGPVRAIFTLKSEPFTLDFSGAPYFDKTASIQCSLYRVFYTYPGPLCPFYLDELFVLTEDEHRELISFRPYYSSDIYPAPESFPTDKFRFEDIPDYFAIWKQWANQHHGYAFASDAHVRSLDLRGSEINWRFSLARSCRCVHYFLFYCPVPETFDPVHIIGHYGWYEKVFKPIESVNLSLKYPIPPEM